MNIDENNETVPVEQRSAVDKRALSAHYRVSLRTIEQWTYCGFITGQKKAGKFEFNLADCDSRLLPQERKTKNYEKN